MAIQRTFTVRKPSLSSATTATTTVSTANAVSPTTIRKKSKPSISYHLLSVQLDLPRLRSFLVQTIPLYCRNDIAFIQMANDSYNAIHTKVLCTTINRNSIGVNASRRSVRRTSVPLASGVVPSRNDIYNDCWNELNDCITIISTFLSSCRQPILLLSQALVEAHYLIGCINETLHQTQPAKQSYINALWILSAHIASGTVHVELLATTLHCLGRIYGELDQQKQALHLLRNAQQHYTSINVPKNHFVMMNVQHWIDYNSNQQQIFDIANEERLKQQQQQQQNGWSSTSSSLTVSLTSIVEDDDEEQQ